MGFSQVSGIDAVLDAPPLVAPPLSLLDLARPLVDVEGMVADAQAAAEQASSAQAAVARAEARLADAGAAEQAAAAMAVEAAQDRQTQAEAWVSASRKALADRQRWEHGFQYLPELGLGGTEGWAADTTLGEANLSPEATALKARGDNRPGTAWYDPFTVIGRDERSLFGWPHASYEERALRALRALRAHEAWRCEREFWAGGLEPTNLHLSASPATPTSGLHRDIDAWGDPTPAPGTTLGAAVGLGQSLAALDQAIADADAGTGMIHATPFVVQSWMGKFPYIRDSAGRVYTVNMNLIVPGYGYPGTGPDTAARSITDLHTASGDASITSASAAFTTRDIGAPVVAAGVPAGAVIASITSATAAKLSEPATATHAGENASIGGPGGSAGGSAVQWAYATDMVFKCRGDVHILPWGLEQASPLASQQNAVDIRAERSWALLTNRLLRAAVLVDTQTT